MHTDKVLFIENIILYNDAHFGRNMYLLKNNMAIIV